MIDPRELRLGNLVESPGGLIGAVINIKPLFIRIRDTGDKYEYRFVSDLISPICLTPEWLERAGFKKWGLDHLPRTINYELGWIRIFPANTFCDFDGYGFLHYKPDNYKATESARVKIKHLHQLQNLYFALTGEELEIKMP